VNAEEFVGKRVFENKELKMDRARNGEEPISRMNAGNGRAVDGR